MRTYLFLSSKSFMVLDFVFKSLNHFELFFVYVLEAQLHCFAYGSSCPSTTSVLMPALHHFYYCSSVVWNQEVWVLQFCSYIFKIVLAIQDPLQFHMKLKICFFISVDKIFGILIGIVLDLYATWERISILSKLLSLPIRELNVFSST